MHVKSENGLLTPFVTRFAHSFAVQRGEPHLSLSLIFALSVSYHQPSKTADCKKFANITIGNNYFNQYKYTYLTNYKKLLKRK